ncbi:unnamed protein product, partial [Ectocarpus fasciculatus]
RRCVGSGSQCVYGKRRGNIPPKHKQSHPRRPDRDGAHGGEILLQSTPPGPLATSGRLPLTRFRLSASPATGLVGMQENAFLSDFFGCVGFLPLTTHSHIRETMVNIMVSPAVQQPLVGGDIGAEVLCDAIPRGVELSLASDRHQLPMNPSTCTFWAWAIMGYLYGFTGNLANYKHYLALSESYLRSSMEQGSTESLPVGFAEVVKYTEIADSFCGQRQMNSFSAEEQTGPQVRPTIRGGVGSLLINLTLVFEKGAKGDLSAALERIGRCVEVFERYPGLCRGTMGYHNAHIVLVCLAAIGDSRARTMYDSLRQCYNSFRPTGSLPVPPLEDWHGVDAFCDDCYCR